jgi:RHS repeat-associated protein
VITKFIRVGGESIAANKGTSKYFYHNDHLGSVNVVTDINGTRVQLNEYDPWGAASRSEGSIDPDQRFTGQKLDPETGLYYYGGRYYDAEIGRFISADPFVQTIFDPQNLNRYSYVVNNPQNYTDPSGYFHKLVKKKHHGFSFFGTIFGFIFGGPIGALIGALTDFVPEARTAFRVLGIIGGIAMALNGHPEGLLYAASGALAFGKGSGFQYASMALGAAATAASLGGNGSGGGGSGPGIQVACTFCFGLFSSEAEAASRSRNESDGGGSPGARVWRSGGSEPNFRGLLQRAPSSSTASTKGFGSLSQTEALTINEALTAGAKWVGPGYQQLAPGVFRSADGLRQFRMTTSDILGRHGNIGPHVNFESFKAATDKIAAENLHMPIKGSGIGGGLP